jgi:hypothetical protein
MVGGLRMLSCQFRTPLDDLLFVYHKMSWFQSFCWCCWVSSFHHEYLAPWNLVFVFHSSHPRSIPKMHKKLWNLKTLNHHPRFGWTLQKWLIKMGNVANVSLEFCSWDSCHGSRHYSSFSQETRKLAFLDQNFNPFQIFHNPIRIYLSAIEKSLLLLLICLYVSSRRLYKLWADQPKWVQFMGALESLKLQTTTTTNFSFSPLPPLCKFLHTSILDLSYSTNFYFLLANLCNISWHEKHDFKHIYKGFFFSWKK